MFIRAIQKDCTGKTLKAHSATSKGQEGARQRPTESLPSAVSERKRKVFGPGATLLEP